MTSYEFISFNVFIIQRIIVQNKEIVHKHTKALAFFQA